MRTVIKNGTLAGHDKVLTADISFENGHIVEIGENLPVSGGDAVIDAFECIVMPGGVDAHTHLDLAVHVAGHEVTVSDGWFGGTLAAAHGGTTTVANHPSFGETGCPLTQTADESRKRAEGQAVVDYAVHSVFQRFDEKTNEEIEQALAAGYTSGKFYTTYDGRLVDGEALAVIEALSAVGGLPMVHCEEHEIIRYTNNKMRVDGRNSVRSYASSRPDYAESEAVSRMLAFCRLTSGKLYVVHLSTMKGLNLLAASRAAGLNLIVETCPQYLLLDENSYREGDIEGLKYVMAPPLRGPENPKALWEGLKNGQIDIVGTDHCSFSFKDKIELSEGNIFRCPGGAPGIETRVPLLFSEGVLKGRLTLPRFVSVLCEAPARLLGLKNKGCLEPGYDADIVVLDPREEHIISAQTLHQQCDYTPFEGLMVRGWPRDVWLRGERLIDRGEFKGQTGCGNYLHREI